MPTIATTPKRKPTVWLQPGIVAIYGTSVDAASHSHHALQIVWQDEKSSCQINGEEINGAVIVDAKLKHQLSLEQGWVLLIEPNSHLGMALSEKLDGKPIKTFAVSPNTANSLPRQNESITPFLTSLFEQLHLSQPFQAANKTTVQDKRIQQLLTELNQCFLGDCIKPLSWRAAEVASKLALSESRFLHLFSEEMGIAWRPYLLWRRMICAVKAIISNQSATEAAQTAGFSDSAHLSRTFRSHFGMTIRQAMKLFKNNS